MKKKNEEKVIIDYNKKYENYRSRANDSLEMLRFISNFFRRLKYKEKSMEEILTLLEISLGLYSTLKIKDYGGEIQALTYGNFDLKEILPMLNELLKEKDRKEFFNTYIYSIGLVISAVQDEEVKLNNNGDVDDVIIEYDNNMVTAINTGKYVEPIDKVIIVMDKLKEHFITKEKEVSK